MLKVIGAWKQEPLTPTHHRHFGPGPPPTWAGGVLGLSVRLPCCLLVGGVALVGEGAPPGGGAVALFGELTPLLFSAGAD